MHRASFLASEQIATMSYLIGPDDKEKPDWTLWLVARLVLAHRPSGQARCGAMAFIEFHAESELKGQPEEIATLWFKQAEYSDVLLPDLHRYVDPGKVA